MILQEEKFKQDGRAYVTCYSDDVVNNGYLLLRIKGRPTGWASLKFVFATRGEVLVNFETDTFISPGNELTPVNLNQNSTRPAEHQVFVNPTGEGTPDRIIPSVGTDTGKGISFYRDRVFECGGFLMGSNTDYLLSCQNIAGSQEVISCSVYVSELP